MQDLRKGVQDMDCQRRYPVESSGGIFPQKMFKIEALRNEISGILRASQHVVL